MSFQPSQAQISFQVVAQVLATSMLISTDKAQYTTGETITVSAQLFESIAGIGVPNATVNLLVDGTVVASGITNLAGLVTFFFQSALTGIRTITAQFNGTSTHSASQASTTVSIIAVVVATAMTIALNKAQYTPQEAVTVTMRLTRTDTGGGVSSALITVFLNGVQQGAAVATDVSGNATKTFAAPLGIGTHTVLAQFAGGSGFSLAEATVSLTVSGEAITPTIDPATVGLIAAGTLGAIGVVAWLWKRKK